MRILISSRPLLALYLKTYLPQHKMSSTPSWFFAQFCFPIVNCCNLDSRSPIFLAVLTGVLLNAAAMSQGGSFGLQPLCGVRNFGLYAASFFFFFGCSYILLIDFGDASDIC